MAAPAKFLFDIDFAAGAEREPTVSLSEHAGKLAEAETAAHRRGYAEGQHDAEVETGRRIAATLERIAAGIDRASSALKAIEARLECEAVEVAVAVARKLAPSSDRTRAVRGNIGARRRLLSRACRRAACGGAGQRGALCRRARENRRHRACPRICRAARRAWRTHDRGRRLPDRMGGRRRQS